MNEPWLDSLSEDWEVEARSSPPASLPRGSPTSSVRQLAHQASPNGTTRHARNDASPGSVKNWNKTSRSNNSIPIFDHSSLRKSFNEHSTMSSNGSVVVARKSRSTSPPKNRNGQDANTPEWKKLIMKGQNGLKIQQDLFSPVGIGLQGIFTQPEEDDGTGSISKKMPKLSFLKNFEALPSSPPPWPKSNKMASVRFAEFPTIREAPEPLSEWDDSEQDPEYDDSGRPEDSMNESSMPLSEDGQHIEEARSRAPESRTDSSLKDVGSDIEATTARAQQQSTSGTVRSTVSHATSGASGFSPVLISKFNTADGKIDYTPLDTTNPVIARPFRPSSRHDDEEDFESELLPQDNMAEGRTEEHEKSQSAESAEHLESSIVGERSSIAPADSISQVYYFGNTNTNAAPQPLATSTTAHIASQAKKVADLDIATDAPRTPPEQQSLHLTPQPAPRSASPLKLFANNDTWTNGRLMNRMAQLHGTEASAQSQSARESPIRRPKKNNFSFRTPMPEKLSTPAQTEALQSPLQHSQPITPISLGITTQHDQSPELHDYAGVTQAKRGPSPPSKHPTPKRQRTLFPDELATATQGLTAVVEDEHRRMVAAATADGGIEAARMGDDSQETSTIAEEISFSPTPVNNLLAESDQFSILQSRIEEASVADGIDDVGTVKLLATEVAKFQLRNINHLKDSARKPSVSTQDYLDEALKIMDIIRSSRPVPSELPSLEEEEQSLDDGASDMFGEDASQNVARPPSRDGSAWRTHGDLGLDPRVVSRLEKYAENGDDTFMMSSQMRSLKASNQSKDPVDRNESSIQAVETDLPNIRISGPRTSSGYRVTSLEKYPSQHSTGEASSLGSAGTAGQSIGTNSTCRTKSVPVISPGKVSHLISSIEDAAGMRYDRERQAWVKDKAKRQRAASAGMSSSTGTSDPFEQIPDLSTHGSENQSTPPSPAGSTRSRSPRASATTQDSRAVSGSSGPSLSQFPLPSGGLRPTRASLISRDRSVEVHPERRQSPSIEASLEREEVCQICEDDISQMNDLHEDELEQDDYASEDLENIPPSLDRICPTPSGTVRSKRRELSTNSSLPPPASHIWDPEEYERATSGAQTDYDYTVGTTADAAHVPIVVQTRTAPTGDLRRQALRNVSHAQSNRIMSIAQINEHREISFVQQRPDGRTMSMTLSMSTPLRLPIQGHGAVSAQHRENSEFLQSLSPLSEFTVNQDNNRHLQKHSLSTQSQTNLPAPAANGPALVVTKLVEKLTDVEPEEPYWDSMQALDLRKKNLFDVHMLDQFCPGVEELDLSENRMQQLGGVPLCVRQLKVRDNCLSSLTTWTHLPHLQYLDISGNALEGLEGLSDLLHLRELKADNNNLTSIEGVFDLDSLLSLSVRGNKLVEIDFGTADLKRLQKLDIGDNALVKVEGLHCLPELMHLDVSHNQMQSFLLDAQRLKNLRTLHIGHNQLTILDITPLPSVSYVDLDDNQMGGMPTLPLQNELTILSIRNQAPRGIFALSSNDLERFSDLTQLNLSGTSLEAFPISSPFLNLRILELAMTGLQVLPSTFGKMAPNLRELNLNMNAIKDLRPIRGIAKLNKLYMAGNRLSRLRRAVDVVQNLAEGGVFESVDFRNNPVSVGFYGTSQTASSAGRQIGTMKTEDKVRQWDREAASKSLQYLLPTGDDKLDRLYEHRLDEDTKLRRRVYEMLLATKCTKLEIVDGLPWSQRKAQVLRKDETWSRLREMGVVADKASN